MNFDKILSAGCSFIQGNELGDEFPFSQHTYPALLAKHFDVAYDSVAYASASNQGIAKKLFEYPDYNNTLVIVQWSFPSRLGVNLSYYIPDKTNQYRTWFDLAPNHWDLKNVFDDGRPSAQQLKVLPIWELSKMVYTHFGNDEHFLFQTKMCLEATKNFLSSQQVPYLFLCATAIDGVDTFEDLGFIDWAKKHKFAHGEYKHPLHDAHKSACKYILDNDLITKSQQH